MFYTVVFWVSLVSNVIIHKRLSCVGCIIITFYCAGGAFGRQARERRPEDGLRRHQQEGGGMNIVCVMIGGVLVRGVI